MEELITEMEITDTEDGGVKISCILDKELVQTILTMWMHDAIKNKAEEVLKNYNEVFERLPEETPEVPAQDGSSPKRSEVASAFQTPFDRYRLYNDGPPNPSDQR